MTVLDEIPDGDLPELVHRNPDTEKRMAEAVARLGGRCSLLERLRHPTGSPYAWYEAGWEPLDRIQERAPDMLRLGFERLRSGLILYASQRHDAWMAVFPDAAWSLSAEAGAVAAHASAFSGASAGLSPSGEHHLLRLNKLELLIRIPVQNRERFYRFSEAMELS